MLPISAQGRTVTPFHEALFTATSAVCVTGLVVRDTASHWSAFGQAVLMVLIRNRRLGCDHSRRVFLAFIRSAHFPVPARADAGGHVCSKSRRHCAADRLCDPYLFDDGRNRRALYAPGFLPGFRRFRGYGKPFFISVSAFCNAGFDLMGTPDMPFVSLTAYRADPVISLTISALIVVGGIGFLTWDDVRTQSALLSSLSAAEQSYSARRQRS